MKNVLTVTNRTANHDLAVLLLRIAIGTLMLTHGIPKLLSLVSGQVQFPGLFGLSPALSLSLAVFAEVGCSLLILFGVGTRLATIPLMFTMLVAVFYIHAADPLAKKEVAILYLLAYIILFFTGSGKYSLENLKRIPA
ncbi:DoxX family protein [Flavihumibacter fluvii]|uniref:DoxX family protein n=1 Tax=Flavihumibacter fluvii TaxID=2838157 RepID=UPI001BDE1E28|nr:DoxX family protein [Flavihumibacter fluvii]ULQ54033.1 DoxX family protein [Flavihumibacter fluvii]